MQIINYFQLKLSYPHNGIQGNSDATTIVKREISLPLMTSQLKIIPQLWSGGRIGLSVRLYGYQKGTKILNNHSINRAVFWGFPGVGSRS